MVRIAAPPSSGALATSALPRRAAMCCGVQVGIRGARPQVGPVRLERLGQKAY